MLLILGALAAVCVGSLGAVLTVEAQVKDPENGKVRICHYPGHDGDERIGGKEILACEDRGGNAIEISENACDGHGVPECGPIKK